MLKTPPKIKDPSTFIPAVCQPDNDDLESSQRCVVLMYANTHIHNSLPVNALSFGSFAILSVASLPA